MKKPIIATFAMSALAIFVLTALAVQPDKEKGPPPDKKGPPPGWQPGKIIPPHVREALELTEAQESKIAELEKEVRMKLLNIFTDEQKQRLKEFKGKGPKGPPKGDKDGPPEKGKGKDKDKDNDKDKDKLTVRPNGETKNPGPVTAIQWYASWESGSREASLSGRPILLVSAAPHCAGVSGTW